MAASASGTAARFHDIDDLNRGTFGSILSAVDSATGDQVAIKVFRGNPAEGPEGLPHDAVREVFLLSQLSHEGIIEALEVLEDESGVQGHLRMVMPRLATDLHRWRYALPSRSMKKVDAQRFLSQFASAVAYLHEQHVMHRDIKPGNILVDAQPGAQPEGARLRLADFGNAARFGADRRCNTLCVSTQWYRAPEVMLRDPSYGCAVDVWGMALVYAELRLGSAPFAASSDEAAMKKIFQTLGVQEWWHDVEEMPHFAELAPRGLQWEDERLVWEPAEDGAAPFPALDADENAMLLRMLAPPATRVSARTALGMLGVAGEEGAALPQPPAPPQMTRAQLLEAWSYCSSTGLDAQGQPGPHAAHSKGVTPAMRAILIDCAPAATSRSRLPAPQPSCRSPVSSPHPHPPTLSPVPPSPQPPSLPPPHSGLPRPDLIPEAPHPHRDLLRERHVCNHICNHICNHLCICRASRLPCYTLHLPYICRGGARGRSLPRLP